MKLKLVILIVGILGGAAIVHFYGAPIRQTVGLEGREVEAHVLEERRDEDGRLVLMLESDGESMLATFRERADDVASLVHVGDIISFRAPADGVFSDDVPLISVRRSDARTEGEDPDELEGESDGEEETDAEPGAEEESEMLEDGADGAGTDEDLSEEAEDEDEALDMEALEPVADSTSAEVPESAES